MRLWCLSLFHYANTLKFFHRIQSRNRALSSFTRKRERERVSNISTRHDNIQLNVHLEVWYTATYRRLLVWSTLKSAADGYHTCMWIMQCIRLGLSMRILPSVWSKKKATKFAIANEEMDYYTTCDVRLSTFTDILFIFMPLLLLPSFFAYAFFVTNANGHTRVS